MLVRLRVSSPRSGAFVYTFIEPGQTYSSNPHYDLDMPSFGIVKVFPVASGQGYEETATGSRRKGSIRKGLKSG